MRDEALFLNGEFENVLEDILKVQAHLPEQILYLQPYSGSRIGRLVQNRPSVDDPMRLFCSITTDLALVHFVGEVVGWDDKREIDWRKRRVLNRVIYVFQPTEDGVYMRAGPNSIECVNLLYVRRLHRLSSPFSVDQLIKTSDGQPVSTARTTSGGWTYVENPVEGWLEAYL
jgi:hypothetical protein